MIISFKGRLSLAVWRGELPKGFPPALLRPAQRKLAMVAAAVDIHTLRCPPGNRLEALKGDRVGQYSIRINDQWRVCFVWKDKDAHEVEIVDHH